MILHKEIGSVGNHCDGCMKALLDWGRLLPDWLRNIFSEEVIKKNLQLKKRFPNPAFRGEYEHFHS